MISETSIVLRGLEQLRKLLPSDWSVEAEAVPGGVTILRFTSPDQVEGQLVVEAKRRVPPGAVAQMRGAAERRNGDGVAVLAGWLSPSSRQALLEAGIGFLDLTGNVNLRLTRPGLFLRDVGADHDPEPAPSALKSLRGAGAARAVRALADFEPPYGVRELAQASGASAAVLSRVVALLEREQLVTRDGQIASVDWEGVLRRWAEDYTFDRANRLVPCLDPRGTAAFIRKLGGYASEWAATGTLGVPPAARVVPVQLAAIYVRSPERSLAELELTATASGANVLLIEPPDDGPFARAERGDDGVVRCAPSQVVADLLTGPGRGSAEARALLEWMRLDEATWRRRS
jgi:hypothetical protein